MKPINFIVRQVQKVKIAYQQFLAVVLSLFNTINLFLIPLGQFGVIPVTMEWYAIMWLVFFALFLMMSIVLHKIGAFEESVTQTFDLQQRPLFVRQANYYAILYAEKMNMTAEQRDADKEKWERRLQVVNIE